MPNDFLLSEKELALKYDVSSRAIRDCLAQLEADGLVSREQGRGTIVQDRREIATLQQRQKTIAAVFLRRIRDTWSMEQFDGLQQSFQKSGYATSLLVNDADPEKETGIVQQLIADKIPGLVLFSAHNSDSYQHLLEARIAGMKIAVFDHFFPGFSCNFVGIDDQLGAFEATTHLIRLGCEELLFINSSHPWTTHSLRQKGFEEAIAKLAPDTSGTTIHVPLFDQMEARLRERLTSFLKTAHRRLGVLVWNDQAALAAIDCLTNEGWSVPEDASVIGFANDIESALSTTPLTTVQIPWEDVAHWSASLVMDQLRDPKLPDRHIKIKPRLIIRDSCGCYARPLGGIAAKSFMKS